MRRFSCDVEENWRELATNEHEKTNDLFRCGFVCFTVLSDIDIFKVAFLGLAICGNG